ncbi:MAG: hypothetical protein WBA97_08030 [Actinophytocola sp.]|uniref:Rv1733c family protein n=1 Tax=Actinophytocola sp. TaxID=1872138 RepID=UPI003C76F6E7
MREAFKAVSRLLRPGRNPLARGVDRLESAVVTLAVLIGLVLLPIMLTLGSVIHAGLSERREQQLRDRYETVAVLTEDAPKVTADADGTAGGRSAVPARWELPDGTARTGVVPADHGLDAGAGVTIWLDRTGSPVSAPMSTSDARVTSTVVAVCGWLASGGLLALACRGLHVALDRRRFRAWQVEWARVEPGWHDRTR